MTEVRFQVDRPSSEMKSDGRPTELGSQMDRQVTEAKSEGIPAEVRLEINRRPNHSGPTTQPRRRVSQHGKLQEEYKHQAAVLESVLDRFLSSRDELVEQLQSNQRMLMHAIESMQCCEVRQADSHQEVCELVNSHNVSEMRELAISDQFTSQCDLSNMLDDPRPPRVQYSTTMRGSKTSKSEVSPPRGNSSSNSIPLPTHWRSFMKRRKEHSSLFTRKHYTLRQEYELCMGVVIMASSAYVGWEVQYAGKNLGAEFDANRVGAMLFLVIYFFDLVSRMYFYMCAPCQKTRCHFIHSYASLRNIFDVIVFTVMLLEEFLRLVDFFDSIIVLRILRFLRLLRVLHVYRPLKLFRKFRILMHVVKKCIGAMFWVLVLCGLDTYFFALALAQGSLEHCTARNEDINLSCETFGKLSDAALNLFKAMFGGVLWGDLYDRSKDLGGAYPMIFVLFMSVSVIVVLNVITGVVLEIHQDVCSREMDHAGKLMKEKTMHASRMQSIFEALDINVSGGISLDELKYATTDRQMSAFLESMGLDISDVDELFCLLDRDQTGTIDVEEFVLGGIRMHGAVKTFDVMKLHKQTQSLRETLDMLLQSIQQSHGDTETEFSGPSAFSRHSNDPGRSGTYTYLHGIRDVAGSLRRLHGHWQIIENVEMRAMRIRDLRAVRALMSRHCTKDKWVDPKTGYRLNPDSVNLYHFDYYVISPCSTPEGVSLSGLQHCLVSPGEAISQTDGSSHQIAEGEVERVTHGGCAHVRVTRGRFQAASDVEGSACRIIANGENAGAPSKVETLLCLSYKEAFHPEPVKPMWFCSHWWGEAISDFVSCCEKHAVLRAQDVDVSYWICAYANRQTELAVDMSDDPDSSSFRRAMKLTEGTLLILDDESTPFRRIWCDFELYNTISDNKLLDIVTICDAGGERAPQLLSQGLLAGETILSKTNRETKFPIKSLVAGLNARLEDGAASVQADKEQILRCIGKDRLSGQPGNEAATILALQRANRTLHSYLAQAAWPQAMKKSGSGKSDASMPLKLGLPEILSQDDERKVLHMSFAHLLELTDVEMRAIAKSFPAGLLSLHLSFEGCTNISDESMGSLGKRMPQNLQELVLDFVGCKNISDEGLSSLAVCLPQDLRELRLDFALCNRIGLPGIKILDNNLPRSLVNFAATFQGTEVDRKFESVQELHKFCKASAATKLSIFNLAR